MVLGSKNINSFLRKFVRFAGRTDIFFYAILWLAVLLTIGTVSQKTIGLYQAQERFFSSWFLWLGGFIPVPGTMMCLTVVFLGLLVKLSAQKWTKINLGTLVIHIGALLLLLGGFITAVSSEEGYVIIKEGDTASYVEDYFEVELAILDAVTEEQVAIFKSDTLRNGYESTVSSTPFVIEIDSYHKNVIPVRRDIPRTEDAHGMAQNIELKPLPRSVEEESNNAGLNFYIRGAGQADGFYSIFEQMPVKQTVTTDGGRSFVLDLRPVRTKLPFSIYLQDFKKEVYPGTDMARSYRSVVVLRDRDRNLEWQSIISMNEPLRYKGYTLYQSSFLRAGEQEFTVLALVRNAGRLFPYISSIVICIGLLIHLFIRVPALTGGRQNV